VIEGRQADHGAAWPAIGNAPELAQAPYGEQARNYLQSRFEDRQQGAPPFSDRGSLGRTVAEVIGEGQLNLAMVERRDGLLRT